MQKKTVTLTYSGNLRTEMVHEKSGETLITDAPTDNHGKGEAFSPTDLIAASMLSCMVTVMGIKAEKKGVRMGKVTGWVNKTMAETPRRVAALDIEISLKGHSLSAGERSLLENTAMNCPVAKSLHPDLLANMRVKFHYE